MPDPRDPDDDDDLDTLAGGAGAPAPGGRPRHAAGKGPASGRAPDVPTETEAPTGELSDGVLDLESLPPRPRSQPSAARPGSSASTSAPTSASRPPAGSAAPANPPEDEDDRATMMSAAPATPGDDDEDRATLVSAVPLAPPDDDPEGATVVSSAPGTGPESEPPTSEIAIDRDLETVAGPTPGLDTHPGGTVADDDRATMADGSQAAPAGPPSSKTVKRPTSGVRAPTVADAAAPSASSRSQGPVPASKWSRGTARDPAAGTAALRGSMPGTRPGAPTMLAEGQLLADRYELTKRLGKGGMGEVWQARHTLLQGMRAIKVIKASISRDPSFRARFLSEGQTMMRVKHPGVVEVTDLDETKSNRELFMVMEHLEGRTMNDAVRDEKAPLGADVRNAVRIHRELALGMQRIHDERIVHKDLKTDNVILVKGDDGLEHPKVIDFGLAKRLGEKGDVPAETGATHAAGDSHADLRTTLSGTLAYMAPEQFLGEPSTFQTDIYAFGVMLFECFTKGEYPMPRGSLVEYIRRHKDGEVPRGVRQARPDIDPEVAELADRCMAPAPASRPASFQEVADAMQWWLDAPERAARRKRVLAFASVFVVLASAAVYGIFFKKQLAGVQNVSLRREGGAEIAFRGKRFYLGAGALNSVEFEGSVTGEAAKPSLLVDGVEHEAEVGVNGRTLQGRVSLAGLADGEHVLGFRAAPDAEPATVAIVVDRAPPQVRSIELSDGSARFTKSKNPALRIRLDTPESDVAGVSVEVAGAAQAKSADRDPADPTLWTVSGLTSGEGEAKVRVFATDLAGNRSPNAAEFSFVQDTVAPTFELPDLFGGKLQVRDAAGNHLVVIPGEDVKLVSEFTRRGGSAPERAERNASGGKKFDVAVPDVPAAGLVAKLVATDAAGNATTREFPVEVVADEVSIETPDGRRGGAVRSSAGLALRVRRTYPLGSGLQLTRARVRGADGSPSASQPSPVDASFVPDRDRPTDGELRVREELPAGEYGLSIAGAEGARPLPFTLIVDSERPRVTSWSVRDAQGRAVATDGWCLTQDAVVEVEVSDLSIESVTLGGAAPSEPVEKSRSRYTFRTRLAEGVNALALAVRDAAGNSDSDTVLGVNADWTDPRIALRSPQGGDALDDKTPTLFAGKCSEDAYTLVVQSPGKVDRSNVHDRADFEDLWLLPAGDYPVSVVAVDRAGRRSDAVVVAVRVLERRVELPDLIPWATGVKADMRKVVAGDVVIDGRTQPVALVFLDRTEVTNRQYREFLKACEAHRGAKTPWDHADQPAAWSHFPAADTWNDPKWNADDLPVTNVAWWDAYAFANWSGRRLPTEAEWVKAAAKAVGELELRAWPPIAAGDPWKEGLLATSEATGQRGPVDATTSRDESPAKCLHMGGNVSEWVDVPFARDGEPKTGVRGGSWWTSRFGADVRRVPTKPYDRSFRARTIGFRCAVDAGQVKP